MSFINVGRKKNIPFVAQLYIFMMTQKWLRNVKFLWHIHCLSDLGHCIILNSKYQHTWPTSGASVRHNTFLQVLWSGQIRKVGGESFLDIRLAKLNATNNWIVTNTARAPEKLTEIQKMKSICIQKYRDMLFRLLLECNKKLHMTETPAQYHREKKLRKFALIHNCEKFREINRHGSTIHLEPFLSVKTHLLVHPQIQIAVLSHL